MVRACAISPNVLPVFVCVEFISRPYWKKHCNLFNLVTQWWRPTLKGLRKYQQENVMILCIAATSVDSKYCLNVPFHII